MRRGPAGRGLPAPSAVRVSAAAGHAVRGRAAGGRAALVVAAATLAWAAAQAVTTFTVRRDDTELVISNRALASEGARSIGNNPNCEDGMRLTIVYGPPPGHVETRVEDAVITSHLALVRTPAEAKEGGGQETLELTGATVTFNRPGCIEESTPSDEPAVTLVQGRTTVVGTRFFLDREENVGTMDGPISLTRAPADEGEAPLTASSSSMTFAVDEQRATLQGDVRVTSQERTTTGDTLTLDEEAGTAVLTGSPARSVRGSDVLEGARLLYYLDSDDVVVIGNVAGELEVEIE